MDAPMDLGWFNPYRQTPIAFVLGLVIFFGGLVLAWLVCKFIVQSERYVGEMMRDSYKELNREKNPNWRYWADFLLSTVLWLVLFPLSIIIQGLFAIAGIYALLSIAKVGTDFLRK